MLIIAKVAESKQNRHNSFDRVVNLLSYKQSKLYCNQQRWSRGHKARGQGQGHKKILRPRQRTDPVDARAKDQGHRRKCSKKKVLKIFFRRSQKKRSSKIVSGEKRLQKFFSGNLYLRKPKKRSLQIFRMVSGVFQRNFNGSKIVLSSSRGQDNFRGLEASRPRTSKCVLENVIEAKDVLKDSTSGNQFNHRSFNPRFGYHGALYFAFACLSSRYSETSTYNENCFSSFNFYQRTIANV